MSVSVAENVSTIKRIKGILGKIAPFAFAGVCLWLLAHQLGHIDADLMWRALLSVSPMQWIGAALATMISFYAVARYDIVAHRHFGTGLDTKRATLAGATAIGLSQTTGLGLIVSSFIRWRMQPSLGLVVAAKISAFVAITFLSAWAIVTAASLVLLPAPDLPMAFVPVIVLILGAGAAMAGFMFPVIRFASKTIEFPTLPAIGAMLILCFVDTLAAAGALYILMPAGVDISFASLFPIFMLALGAALLSGTPAGVGPFELVLFALLPFVAEEPLLAGILAFRMVYYIVPALIALVVILRPQPEDAEEVDIFNAIGNLDRALRSETARAELGVVRQNGGAIVHCSGGVCAVVKTGQTLTVLFDPVKGQSDDLIAPLRKIARDQNRILCKYKIGPRQAARARGAGWAVLHVADEALIHPQNHTLDGRAHRQLRRKLRHAEKAGITVRMPTDTLPYDAMADVSGAWEDAHGVARGLSMGRFDNEYITHQEVFLAYQGDRLVGFVTFHTTGHEWCLDLMRVLPDAPDGTMHQLVHMGILEAAKRDVPCLSLAAVPARAQHAAWFERKWRDIYNTRAGGPGLTQFKACFAPRWAPRYMAARDWLSLGLAAMDLVRAVNRNETLQQPRLNGQSNMISHNDYEKYEFAHDRKP